MFIIGALGFPKVQTMSSPWRSQGAGSSWEKVLL